MNRYCNRKPKPETSFLVHTNKLLFVLVFTCGSLFSMSSYAQQNCQGSYDQEDLNDGRIEIRREFRCGTGMMEDRMYSQRLRREGKGFYDIEGLQFYESAGYYMKDEKLYYSSNQDTFTIVPGGDVASLKKVGNFIRDNNNVYHNGKAQDIVDAKSFLPLEDSPYAKDDRHVYYSASRNGVGSSEHIKTLEGADPNFFRTLCFQEQKTNYDCYYYGKDKEHVYYSGEVIRDADPNSFKLEEDGYASDNNFVYYAGFKFENSHGGSFKKVGHYYMRDKNQVYFFGDIIPDVDGSKFKLLGLSGMGTDGVHICYQSEIIPNGDPDSFIDLGCGYYKDANNVYSRGQIVASIDPNSFEILDWGFTKDKNGVYCDDEIIPDANPESFEVLGRKYSRDKKHVFYLRQLLPDCEHESFLTDITDPNMAEDSKATYFRGERTEK